MTETKCGFCNGTGEVVLATTALDSTEPRAGWDPAPRPGPWATSPRPSPWAGSPRPSPWAGSPRPSPWARGLNVAHCHYCEGTGIQKYADCPDCRGAGHVTSAEPGAADMCQTCAGTGKTTELTTVAEAATA
jgi:hypothetical protein